MNHIKIIISIFCLPATIGAMEFSSQTLIDELLKQPETTFTAQEKIIFQDLKNNIKNASIPQLFKMKCTLNAMMINKLGHPQYPQTGKTNFFYKGKCNSFLHDETINKTNDALQLVLTHRICKKIESCLQITALTGAGLLLMYGITLLIQNDNEKIR